MTHPVLHPTPRLGDVAREQLRVVGLALRGPAAAAAALAAVATLLLAAEIVREGDVVDFHPERHVLPALVGLLLPIALWKEEERSGAGFLWTLPVDRRRHALARVFAGWAWLMGAVALFVLWLLGLALLSGGNVLAEETLRFLPSSLSTPSPLDPAGVRTVRWTPDPLLWLVPFTAATAAYLLATALALGLRHPLRWIAATLIGVFLAAAAADGAGRAADAEWLVFAPSRLLSSLLHGPLGVETLLTAGSESLVPARVGLTTGEVVPVRPGLPDPGRWALATLLWTGAGLAALWAAASRHRERRRG